MAAFFAYLCLSFFYILAYCALLTLIYKRNYELRLYIFLDFRRNVHSA